MPSVQSQSHITDQIAAFSLAYPRITLTVDFSDTRRALIDDGFDLAIRMGSKSKSSATSRTLFKVRRVLVASKTYLSNRVVTADPMALADWDWLALAPVQNIPLSFKSGDGEAVKIKPSPHMLTNDTQALHRLAYAGAGLEVARDQRFCRVASQRAKTWAYSPCFGRVEPGKNLTDVAFEVGYASPTQFSREYLREFGHAPRLRK